MTAESDQNGQRHTRDNECQARRRHQAGIQEAFGRGVNKETNNQQDDGEFGNGDKLDRAYVRHGQAPHGGSP